MLSLTLLSLPFLFLLVTLPLVACTPPGTATGALPAPRPGEVALSVIERDWHTDIGLPVEALSGPLADLAGDYPGARFLVFGFGNRRFYMFGHETPGEMLTALFPGPGVVLLTALRASPQEAFGAEHEVVTLGISPQQAGRIAAYVRQALETGPDGRPRRLGDGPYPGSAFYASGDIYDAFDTCNTWIARALAAGALPITPRGVLFSGQVMEQMRRLAARQGDAAVTGKVAEPDPYPNR